MSDGDYIFGDTSNTFRKAMAAEEAGEYEKAYKLFGDLWASESWREDRDVQLHYAKACEHVGDYATGLKIYTKLMESMTLNPHDSTGTLIQSGMSRLNDLLHASTMEGTIEGETLDIQHSLNEGALVHKLFKHATDRLLHEDDVLCDAEDFANDMWLLESGDIDVIINKEKISTLEGRKGMPCLMGEVAYFTGMKRAATLRCSSPVRLKELSFSTVSELLAKDEEIEPLLDHIFRSRLGFHLLGQHSFFAQLDEEERKKISLMFKHTSYLAGKIIVEQGLPRNNAFMVQSGTVLMLKKNEKGSFELMSSLHPGDICHIGGLLKNFKSPYRLVTGTPCRLLRLKTETFEPLLKRHPALVKSILSCSREETERHVAHPETRNLWAADRYIKVDGK